jgi:TRAP-type C4-dicarboxylate transport system permease small subunit
MQASDNQTGGLLAPLARVALACAGGALVLLACVEAWQVVGRYVLNDSPGWTEPAALLLMKCAFMLGAAAGVRSESHFRFALLLQAARGPLRRILLLAARLLTAGIGSTLAVSGTRAMVDAWSVPMAGLALPSGLLAAPFVVGGALIAVFSLERAFIAGAATEQD